MGLRTLRSQKESRGGRSCSPTDTARGVCETSFFLPSAPTPDACEVAQLAEERQAAEAQAEGVAAAPPGKAEGPESATGAQGA